MKATEIVGSTMICPSNEKFNLTCIARDSFFVLWRIDNFTVEDNTISLRFICTPDHQYYNDEFTIGNITVNITSNIFIDNGNLALKCHLEISQADSDLSLYQNLSVSCINVDVGSVATHNLSLSSMYISCLVLNSLLYTTSVLLFHNIIIY